MLLFQCTALLLCHIFITKIGFMYVNSEVSQLNDQALFDVLEEKIFVLDQDSKKVLWQNQAAKQPLNNDSFSVSLNAQGLLFESKDQTYAIVKPEMLK